MDNHGSNVKARVAEFDAQNGNEFVCVDDWLVFSNGARRDRDPNGVLFDPSLDDYERSKIIVTYWEERVRRAREAFDDAKEHFVGHAQVALVQRIAPPAIANSEDAVEALSTLKAALRSCQVKLQKARTACEEASGKSAKKRDEQSAARCDTRNREDNRMLLSAIRKIKI